MKKILLAAVLALTLFFAGCDRDGGPLGDRVSGFDISYFLTAHPDWSATGPVVDENYRLVSPQWVRANISTYSFGDCDDWAGDAWRHAQTHGRVAFGMVISSNITSDGKIGGHAFCFFITPDYEIWGYEPQTHRVWQMTQEEMWYASRHWI
jgi:hypothetical protein